MVEKRSAPRRNTLLVIMDGFGVNPSKRNNAVCLADTPRLDEYFARYPHTTLEACGRAVGLPEGQMGNSEVGHLTIGSGSVVRQDLPRFGLPRPPTARCTCWVWSPTAVCTAMCVICMR